MMKLHGYAVSNYTNKIKLILLEKNVEFEEVRSKPERDAEFLKVSVTGKIPALETEKGPMVESQAIAEYLEEVYPEPALLPGDAFEKAWVRQISAVVELFIDQISRKVYVPNTWGREWDKSILPQVTEDLKFYMNALDKLVEPGPYLTGDRMTLADISAFVTLPIVHEIVLPHLEENVFDKITWYDDFMKQMLSVPSAAKVERDRQRMMKILRRKGMK